MVWTTHIWIIKQRSWEFIIFTSRMNRNTNISPWLQVNAFNLQLAMAMETFFYFFSFFFNASNLLEIQETRFLVEDRKIFHFLPIYNWFHQVIYHFIEKKLLSKNHFHSFKYLTIRSSIQILKHHIYLSHTRHYNSYIWKIYIYIYKQL